MKIKKILIGLLACLTLGVATVGLASCDEDSIARLFGQKGKEVYDSETGLYFELNEDKTAYTVDYASDDCTDIVIPSTYKDLPVTSIGSSAFRECSSLTSITIPESITFIGQDPFPDSLTDVYITDIAAWCNITFDDYTSTPFFRAQKPNLYLNNELVTELVIPDTVTEIKANAFSGCSSLTSVTIGDSVTSIGSYAFSYCSSLTSITIPDSVTSIGENVFFDCDSLESITLPFVGATKDGTENTYFGYIFFNGGDDMPESLKEVIITSAASIGDWAFAYCDNLASVTIGNGVTSIGDYAFSGCISLTSVTIGNGVTYIGEDAFYNCSSLTSVTIPDSVTSIGGFAFQDCSSLTSVTIPDSVTSIGRRAFDGCSSLTYTIKNGLKYLGNTNNPYLYLAETITLTITTATIDSNCKFIDSYAFMGCSSLTSITIPDSVTSIGEAAFDYCSSLTYTIKDGLKYLGNTNNPYIYLAGTTLKDIATATIDNNCKFIGSYAFRECYDLISVTIPDSVTSIGSFAFDGCSSIKSVTIPDSVTSIGEAAFYECSSLTSVTIGNSVTSIGDWAFSDCSSLTIYCEATSQPSGWGSDWNYSDRPVVWGYTGEE